MRTIIVLLVAVVLVVNVAAVVETSSKTPHSVTSANYETPASRLLRVDVTTNIEDRVLAIPPPSVALFTNWAKSLGLKITDSLKARWWLWKKQSAENVFKQLKLDSGLNKILDNPKLKTWATYVDLLNRKNPDKKVTTAEILIKTYGDLPVAVMLQSTQSSPKLANRLRVEQANGWKNSGKKADDVFTLLKLDKTGDDLFVSPQLNTWYNYVTWIEKENAKAVMAKILLAHYGDEALQKIFLEANPPVRRMRFVRMWLETAVAKYRPRNEPSPEEYFKVLKLDAGVDKLLANPNLEKWVTYVSKFNQKNPGEETTTIQTLSKFYGDEDLAKVLEPAKKVPQTEKVAKELQAAQFKQWLKEYSPDDVFKLLKLDTDVDTLLTNPSLVTFITFLGQFNANNRGKGTTMIKTFTKFYGDIPLAKMLEAARNVPQTEKVATQFQTAQFTQWFRDGKKHPEIWSKLTMDKATWMENPDAQIWYRYKDFYKARKQLL